MLSVEIHVLWNIKISRKTWNQYDPVTKNKHDEQVRCGSSIFRSWSNCTRSPLVILGDLHLCVFPTSSQVTA